MLSEKKLLELKKISNKVRIHVLKMVFEAQSGHLGGAFSATEILTSLYFHEMNFNAKKPEWSERDYFILSKGHACAAQYACMALAGYFSEKELMTFRKLNSRLQGHPAAHDLPGIEASNGPLGFGLSIANGIALGNKLNKFNSNIFVLMGDGELQEGMIWEAVMNSAQHKLNKLIAFVDYNNLQIDGKVSEIKEVAPIAEKFKAFNWNALECNGHDFNEIISAIQKAKESKEKPTVIVCKTIKGKNVSFMENECDWHGVAPNKEQFNKALKELKEKGESLGK
jgi:transketolase